MPCLAPSVVEHLDQRRRRQLHIVHGHGDALLEVDLHFFRLIRRILR